MGISEFYLEQKAIIKKLESLGDNPKLSQVESYELLCRISKMIDIIADEWNNASKQLENLVHVVEFGDVQGFRVLPPNLGKMDSGWKIDGFVRMIDGIPMWIEEFKAVHPMWGTVEGNFNKVVTAHGGKVAYDEFIKAHPYRLILDNLL